jgi:hypothetical protein
MSIGSLPPSGSGVLPLLPDQGHAECGCRRIWVWSNFDYVPPSPAIGCLIRPVGVESCEMHVPIWQQHGFKIRSRRQLEGYFFWQDQTP